MEEIEKNVAGKIDSLLYEEALQIIDSTPLTYESGINIYPYKGQILYLQKRYEESATFLRRLMESFPQSIKAKRFLYLSLLALGDFRSSFTIAKECWKDGDYRRSTLIRILAHSLVLRNFDFLESLDAHCDEPLLLSMAYIYSGKLDRAVEIMKTIEDSSNTKMYLDALISVRTKSIYMLDYVRYLNEDIFVTAINCLEKKQRVFEKIENLGCKYVEIKIMHIAKKTLGRNEYENVVKSVSSRNEKGHWCRRDCLLGRLRASREERVFFKKNNIYDATERYADLENIFESLRSGNFSDGLEGLKRIYRLETVSDLEKHLKNGQNTLVLNEIERFYLDHGKKEDACHYSDLSAAAHSLRVRDVIECLSRLMDENMIGEIIELLELDLFNKNI
ncbi:hypothetical protein EROM_081590 [Encephalitozoon romaleae SJ-2008]|uniref:Uncharacterized protein n=1 Tax=Encephalitozoon romaleae (strain SJ-2008) TaxID=1178016 RepID=I7AFQ5_ENCRO|nr:hypothetical protein EROM_081590 [Encephalitozoon romaleae SJ-2008]AFN83575.1 hypothetical protein EROM_081590 [Encephalitozoon romaleae SJ-2008]